MEVAVGLPLPPVICNAPVAQVPAPRTTLRKCLPIKEAGGVISTCLDGPLRTPWRWEARSSERVLALTGNRSYSYFKWIFYSPLFVLHRKFLIFLSRIVISRRSQTHILLNYKQSIICFLSNIKVDFFFHELLSTWPEFSRKCFVSSFRFRKITRKLTLALSEVSHRIDEELNKRFCTGRYWFFISVFLFFLWNV